MESFKLVFNSRHEILLFPYFFTKKKKKNLFDFLARGTMQGDRTY